MRPNDLPRYPEHCLELAGPALATNHERVEIEPEMLRQR